MCSSQYLVRSEHREYGSCSSTSLIEISLQKIVGAKQDGAIGPKTLQAVANYETEETIGKLHDSRQKFYERLSHFKTFGRGWTRRNKETLEQAQHFLGK